MRYSPPLHDKEEEVGVKLYSNRNAKTYKVFKNDTHRDRFGEYEVPCKEESPNWTDRDK